MVECTVGLFAALVSTLVHPFNLFISAPGSFVLLGARDGHKRIDLSRC